jgi:hypothetical protein
LKTVSSSWLISLYWRPSRQAVVWKTSRLPRKMLLLLSADIYPRKNAKCRSQSMRHLFNIAMSTLMLITIILYAYILP